MLKLTKKSDYGLIALRHLAVNRAKATATAKEIAEFYRIPSPLLAKVMQKMVKEGFLKSEPGASGGYRLARPADRISTLEVIRAIDGPVFLASCFHGAEDCDQHDTCTVKEPLRKVHEGILALLSSISIQDLATGLSQLHQRNEARAMWPILGNEAPIPIPR